MKVYKGYKEIEIKDIKGVKYNRICNRNLEKVCRYMETIKRNGIKKLVAAKAVGYEKVPCLIRDTKQEILLRKLNKIFKLEDENYAIKDDINNEERLNFYKNNYYKLNIL